ncbi:hypothetical protein GCM10019016_051730 [Streptomyces prasinosporus]|uniref:Uncharacterized protein n=1 Tax=Streptomyces prasinosporus TaxID=68256 RepID=A0ABP6TRZ6_9ACTN
MSDALVRAMDVLAGADEDEVTAVLAAAGASSRRWPARQAGPRTPLPEPEGVPDVHTEVEWV